MRTARRLLLVSRAIPTTVLSDVFTRADSSTTLGTATTGQSWTNVAGIHGISSNKAYAPSTATTDNRATVDCGIADFILTCDLTTSSTANRTNSGFWFRSPSAGNALNVQFFKAGPGGIYNGINLSKYVANVETVLSNVSSAVADGTTYAVRISCNGSSIAVSINGTPTLSATLTGPEMALFGSATTVGFRSYRDATNDDGGSRYDNLLVTTQ